MKKVDYSSLRSLIAIDNQIVRRGVVDALKHAGFRNLTEAGTHAAFHEAIDKSVFDLMIMVSEFSGFPLAPQISELRQGKAKHHPFPIVMMLLPNAETDYVRKVIDCGPDFILLMPVAPGPVLARVEEVSVQRKKFIVTFDYVGPDRRKEIRPGTEQLQQFEVPNPVLARVSGGTEAALNESISRGQIQLHNLRLERYAVQARWLGGTIRAMVEQGELDAAKLPAFAMRMRQIVRDLPPLLRFDMNDQISALLGSIEAGADALSRDGPAIARDKLDDLLSSCTTLSDALRKLLPSS